MRPPKGHLASSGGLVRCGLGTRHHQAVHNHLDQHIREMHVIECGRPQGQQSIGHRRCYCTGTKHSGGIRLQRCHWHHSIAIHHYANHPNFDIVHLLHRAIHKWPVGERDIHLEKIKSHQQGPFSLEDVRKVAGNEAADYAARNVLAETPGNLRSLAHEARVLRTDEKKLMPALLQGATDAVVTYLQAIRALSSRERLQRTRPALRVDADVVFSDINPFFQLPVDDTWRQRACWGVTFTLAAMRWLLLLKWPKDECAEGQVTWIELLLSFKEQTGLAIPAPHPTVYGVYHSPGVHSVLHYEEKSLGSKSWSFNNFLRSLRTITEQEVMPWHRSTSAVGTTPLFGVSVHAGGFNAIFPCENKVRELLDAYFTKQPGRAHTGCILRQQRVPPKVEQEDHTMNPAMLRANYMRFIKSRSKKNAQARRRDPLP